MKWTFGKVALSVAFLVLAACSSGAALDDVPPAAAESPPSTTSTTGQLTEIVFDADHLTGDLVMATGGDVDTEAVVVGSPGESAWRSGNGRVLASPDGNAEPDWYIQFEVDDGFVHEGLPTSHVTIEVEFFDEGNDSFNIQYDAAGSGSIGGSGFKDSEIVNKTGTREFKTALFVLDDAYFGNRTNGGDFRVSDRSDGAETIRRITVSQTAAGAGDDPAATETSLTTELRADQASLIFENGVVLTMEDGSIASSIAIRDGRILAVGSDEHVSAHDGPGTTVIDLGGRTLMPGFVDAHNHVFDAVWHGDIPGGQSHLLANGTTTSAEMFVEEYLIQEMQALERAGELRMRVSLYPVHVDNCGEIRGEWYLPDYPVAREQGAMLHIPGVKLFNDGGSCNVPAVSFEYPNEPVHGDLYFEANELAEVILAIESNGYQVAVHGLGDRAIEANLDALEIVLDGEPNTLHHRLEHNTVVRDEMLPRYSELDAVGMIFGYFPTCWYVDHGYEYLYVTPDEYLDWEWRWRSIIDSNPGAHIAWHSDAPWMGESDPLTHLHGFVTRRQIAEDGSVCEPPDWAADDLLTVPEALEMMTIEGAYALLREEEIGSLSAGKLADLIILSRNPLEVEADDILNIQVLMTMVGGSVEHCLAGHEVICPSHALP